MKHLQNIFFFTSVMLLCACAVRIPDKESQPPPAFDFMHQNQTLTEVIDRAITEDKLVFVDFYAEWCLPCQLMDEEVFSDRKLGEYFNANFINFKVDAEKEMGPDIAFLYGIRAYPTLLFLDTNGRVINKKEGTAFNRELRQLAEESIILARGE
jgi:thiol:disulfide interchange protein